jgi:hypothetical protein
MLSLNICLFCPRWLSHDLRFKDGKGFSAWLGPDEMSMGGDTLQKGSHSPSFSFASSQVSSMLGLRWRSRQSKRLSPLSSCVRFSLRTHVKRISAWVFSGGSGFLPRGKLTGWVKVAQYTF